MISAIVGTIESFYSPVHYRWAAHSRDGIGLSYLFALGCFIFIIGMVVGVSKMGGASVDALITMSAMSFAPWANWTDGPLSNMILRYIAVFFLFSFGVMMAYINLAIVTAIVGMLISYALDAWLDFVRILRISVYVQVPASAAFWAVFYWLFETKQLVTHYTWPAYAYGIVALIYLVIGVSAAKYKPQSESASPPGIY